MSQWSKIGLRWRTARHFRPEQIIWRGYQRGLAKLCETAAEPLRVLLSKNRPSATFAPKINFHRVPEPTLVVERANDCLAGKFTFLNQTADYSQGVNWDAAGFDRLWRFNLHYFDFGLDLALAHHVTGEARYPQTFIKLVTDWEQQVPFARHDGWHPYPSSLRLVNWVFAWHLFGDALTTIRESLATSIWRQLNYIGLHLERDVGGNHLIKNAKALTIGGAFFGDLRQMRRGIKLLETQLEKQVLSDGGHFERSPMYHEQVLQDLCEVAWYLKVARGIENPQIEAAIRKMAEWLACINMPDGEIPLFGDSALGIAYPPGAILRLVNSLYGTSFPDKGASLSDALVGTPSPHNSEQKSIVRLLPESGFLIARHQEQMLVLDCGPFAPDDLPAHGHCDALSFELCLGNERFIVDSGTHSYTGVWRQYFRGTAAHNTVVLPGKEQTEIWGDFRAGSRARVVERELKQLEIGWYFCGAHDGYRPTIHRRHVWCVPGVFWLLEDELSQATSTACSLFHVAPNRQVTVMPDGALLEGSCDVLKLVSFGGCIQARAANYAPRFGVIEEGTVLELPLSNAQRTGVLLTPHGRQLGLSISPKAIEIQDGTSTYVLVPGEINVRQVAIQAEGAGSW